MTVDSLLARELKSLREELSASHRKPPSPPADRKSAPMATTARASPLQEAWTVVGVIVAGLLIGRLLGRR